MWLFTFTAARTALTYITVGALTVIWAGVWYVYLHNNPLESQTAYYWCSGFLVIPNGQVVVPAPEEAVPL